MRIPFSLLLGSLFCLLAFHAEANAFPINRLVYSSDPGLVIGSNFAVTKQGNPLYEEKGLNGENPLYKGRIGGNIPITVIGSNYAAFVNGPVGMNDLGDVTFQSFNPGTAVHGAFKSTGGGQPLTLTGQPFGKQQGAPSMNDTGDVVFLSMDATGSPVLNTRTAGGIIGTIPSMPFVSNFGRPALDNLGQVVTSGQFADGRQGLAVARIGGGTHITIRGDWLRLASGQPKIVDNNKGVLFTVQGDPPQGQPTGQRQHKLAVPDPSGTGYAVATIGHVDDDCDGYINSSLSVACVDAGKLKLFIVDSGNNLTAEATWSALTLLTVGDAFDGSTLTSLKLGDGSMMPDNSVVFHATLANGSSGIYQMVVPEPASMGLLGLAALLARRRR